DRAAHLDRGRVQLLLGQHEHALASNETALRLAPEDRRARNNLAWLWATCPRAELRDGPKAVELARKLCAETNEQDPGGLDTLAAAVACCGQFEEAVQRQQQALELADTDLRADFQRRLELYQAGQTYTE